MSLWWHVIGLLLAMPAVAVAGPAVYKWIDRSGQVHYDDTSVIDGQHLTRELLATRVVPPATDKGLTVPAAWVDVFARQCDRAGSRTTTLESATAVFGLSPGGHEFRFTEQQVRLMIIEARALEKQYCPAGAARQAYRAAVAEARRRQRHEMSHD